MQKSPPMYFRLQSSRENQTERGDEKYRDNMQFIKEDYKLRRDEIIKKFKNKRKK